MKKTLRPAFLYIVLLMGACNSFDKEAFDEGIQDQQKPDYEVPTTVPSTEIQFSTLLHGDLKNEWTPKEFTLEGLLGFQDCRLDDTMILNVDGTYQFDGGAMSCGGSDVASKSGVYELDYDNRELIFDKGTSDEVQVKVTGLDQGIISLSGEVSIFGIPMTIRGVYVAE